MTKMKSALACVCAVLMIALAVVPMFTLSASAADQTATLSFANTAQRTSFSTSQQVWQQNGITFTNDKASSSNNVANYSSPVRLYQNSKITVATNLGNITKIVFDCNSSSYATALKNSMPSSGVTVTVSNDIVTATLVTPASSFEIAKLSAQVRMDSLTVYYADASTPTCQHTNTTEEIVPATCTEAGSRTVTCDDCGAVSANEKINALGHNYQGNVCSVCGEEKPKAGGTNTYTFADYTAGTQYAKNEEHELDELTYIYTTECHFTGELRIYSSSTHNGYAIIKSTNPINKVGVNAGNSADTLVIYGSNDDGATWTEAATIATSSSYKDYSVELAAAYKWLKLDVQGSNQVRLKSITLTTIEVEEEEEVLPEIKGAYLNIGNDLTMNYRVVLPEGADASKYSMQFTLNDKTVTVTACVAVENGYVFAFEGIAPQLMGDTIVAKLLCDGAEVATNEYSVKQYAIDTMATDAKYVTLLSDLLAYGAAAQTYRNYKTDDLVNVNVDGYAPSATAPVAADKVTALTKSSSEVASFTAAGVYFDYTNKIYVKLTATTLEGVVVKVNGTAVNVEAYGNGYIAYSDAVSALDFGKTFTVTLEVSGEVAQTLTYSINSYVFTKCENMGSEPTAMQTLALALYRYGVSALAVKA